MSSCLPGFKLIPANTSPFQPTNEFDSIQFPSEDGGQPIYTPGEVRLGAGVDKAKTTTGALAATGTVTFTVGESGSPPDQTLTMGSFGVERCHLDFQQQALVCESFTIGDNPYGEWVTLFHPGETVWWEVGGHVHAGGGDLELKSLQGNVELQAEHQLCLWATGDEGVRMQLGQGGVASQDFALQFNDTAIETRAPTRVGRILQADTAGVAIPQLAAPPAAPGVDGEVVMVDDGQDVKLYVFCDTQWKSTAAFT